MAALEKHTGGFEQSVASGDIAGASKSLTEVAVPAGARNSRDEKNLLTNAAILFSMVGFQAGLKHTEQPMSGKDFAAQIQAIATKNPGIMANFGGEANFRETLQNISKLDATFASKGGIYFHLGSSPAETAEAFTKIHVEQYRETGRPSLPALVAKHLDALGLSSDNPHYKAALLVAARAELEHTIVPQYHNTNHYADVTAQVAEFLKRNDELAGKDVPGAQKLSVEERADSITAAVGHDLDHPGGKNALPGQKPGEFDPYRLEEKSFKAMEPLLKEAGLGEKAVSDIHTMILTTSPDGPHGVLKAVAKAHQEGETVDWAKIDPNNKFPELKVLADDRKLTVRAAILEDSDLGGSAFEGLKSNVRMSDAFTQEVQEREYRSLSGPNAGKLENLTGPFAREGFSQFVVGQGPASAAAQNAVGQNYTAMRASTQQEIAEIKARAAEANGKAPEATKPALVAAQGSPQAKEAPSASGPSPVEANSAKSGGAGQTNHASGTGTSRGVALGSAGVGLALSVPQLAQAVREGDKASIAINGVNVVASLGGLAATVESVSPIAAKIARVIPGLNVAATLGTIAFETAKEDTTNHMVERAAEGAVLAGGGLGIGAAAGAAAVGAGAATTVAATLSPVVLPLATVALAKADADLIIDTRRIYEGNERVLANMKPARVTFHEHNGSPTIYGFKTLPVIAADILRNDLGLKGEVLTNGGVKNLSDPNSLREIDFSKPGNRKLLEQAIDGKIKEVQTIKDAADYSLLPNAVRSDGGSQRYNQAELQLRTLQVARDELAMFKKDADKYNAKPAVKAGTPTDVVNDGAISVKINLNYVFSDSAAGGSGSPARIAQNISVTRKPDVGP